MGGNSELALPSGCSGVSSALTGVFLGDFEHLSWAAWNVACMLSVRACIHAGHACSTPSLLLSGAKRGSRNPHGVNWRVFVFDGEK